MEAVLKEMIKTNQGFKKKTNKRFVDPFRIRARRFIKRAARVAALAGAVPLLAVAVLWGYAELTTAEALAVRSINVTGTSNATAAEIEELSGIRKGQNIFIFDGDAVEAALKANPWVEAAEVGRSLPDTVNIVVKERIPIALVKLDAMYVMDSSGTVFKRLAQGDDLDLPVVTGLTAELIGGDDAKGIQKGLIRLISILSGRSGFNIANVSEINVDPSFGLSVYTLEDGVRLEVGLDGFEEKLDSFERILRHRGTLDGVEAMDLNDSKEVIVRFSTNVVKEGGEVHGKKG